MSDPLVKIALIKLPATYADWYKRPALGIAYIAACLKSKNYNCKIFDAYFHSWSEAELLANVKKYNPDVVGITAMTHEINQAASISAKLKEQRNVPIVIGGCHVTALPQKTLAEFPVFDYGVCGEGENTLIELLGKNIHLVNETLPIDDVKGVVYRQGNEIRMNESRPFLTSEELDGLPFPIYDDYYDSKALAHKHSYYTIFSSRGCPYSCAFCMQVLGRKVRWRTPENIVNEMDFAIDQYGAHTFDFADEIFLFGNKHTYELLELFIKKGYPQRIKWSALTRANFVTPELTALAKKAGCFRLDMGVESGDDDILKMIGKNITTNMVKKAVAIIKKTGIALGTYYILGHPGENRGTLKKTIDLAVELNTTTIAVGLMVPYPGTRIFEMAMNGNNGYRLLSRNWEQYDKYGGKVLEIEGLSYECLLKYQKKMILDFYLKNYRFLDCFNFFWKRRRIFYFFIRKKLKCCLNPVVPE